LQQNPPEADIWIRWAQTSQRERYLRLAEISVGALSLSGDRLAWSAMSQTAKPKKMTMFTTILTRTLSLTIDQPFSPLLTRAAGQIFPLGAM
jgi:hypothetical protein